MVDEEHARSEPAEGTCAEASRAAQRGDFHCGVRLRGGREVSTPRANVAKECVSKGSEPGATSVNASRNEPGGCARQA